MKIQIILISLLVCLSPVSAAITMPGFLPATETIIQQEIEIEKNQKSKVNNIITNGKGIWVNIWNYPKNLDSFIGKLKKYKIDTVYLQINRSTTEVFNNKTQLDAILKAAHDENIKIIGWSYCYLRAVDSDVEKFVKPALYESPNGDRLDGMAADIEENVAIAAVKSYTEKIKKRLPRNYPLIAIVFSPRIKQNYPWEYIGNNWDVVMPMVYWHGLKNRSHETVECFVRDSILNLRKLCKNDELNIHLITDGERTSAKEVQISLHTAKEHGVNAGFSIYPEHLATDEMLDTLKDFSY